MIDPKRKKIYIIVIILCALGAVGVFMFASPKVSESPEFSSEFPPGVPDNMAGSEEQTGTQESGSFSTPTITVFPLQSTFDFSIFESTVFKALDSYENLVVTEEEIGRDDPFDAINNINLPASE